MSTQVMQREHKEKQNKKTQNEVISWKSTLEMYSNIKYFLEGVSAT